MTSNQSRNGNLVATVIEVLSSCKSEGMKILLETVLNAAMKIESALYLRVHMSAPKSVKGMLMVSSLKPSIPGWES